MTDSLNTLPLATLRVMARDLAYWIDDNGFPLADLVDRRADSQDAEFLIGVIRGVRCLKAVIPDDAKVSARDSTTFTEVDE